MDMTWEWYAVLKLVEFGLLILLWSNILFCVRTVEWFVEVNEGRNWIIIYGGGTLLMFVSFIFYFTHARKYFKNKSVDK